MSIHIFTILGPLLAGVFLFFASCVMRVLFTIPNPPSVFPPAFLTVAFLALFLAAYGYYRSQCVFDHPRRVRLKDITRAFRRTELIWFCTRDGELVTREIHVDDGAETAYAMLVWPNYLSAANCATEWKGVKVQSVNVGDFLCALRSIAIPTLFISLYSYPGDVPKFLYNTTLLLANKADICNLFGKHVFKQFNNAAGQCLTADN